MMWLRRVCPATRSWSAARPASTASRSSGRPSHQQGSSASNRRPQNPTPPNNAKDSGSEPQTEQSRLNTLSSALHDASAEDNTLLAPVHIPEDPNAVLKERHPAAPLLANSALVVQRQLEMMNIMIGFEQANRYVILDAQGNHVGYMAEKDAGMRSMLGRQTFHTHRAFETHVFDKHQNEVLRFHRPFSWINSRIRVYDPLEVADTAHSSFTGLQAVSDTDITTNTAAGTAKVSSLGLSEMRIIGEAHQQWAPLRRKYNLYLFHSNPSAETDMGTQAIPSSGADLSKSQQLQVAKDSGGQFNQFAAVNEPFLSWDFSLLSSDFRLIGSVNRNFAGFGREIFTDTGVYALRMDSAALAQEKEQRHLVSQSHQTELQGGAKSTPMTLDQRAVMLATAVSIDFDYFSRHSGSHGGFMPIPFFGGSSAEGAAGGAAGEAAGGAVGGTAAEEGAATAAGGMAGAGSMAGYEAMRRSSTEAPASDQQPPSGMQDHQPPTQGEEEVWGEDMDFWGKGGGGADGGGSAPTGGEGGGGGGWDLDDFF